MDNNHFTPFGARVPSPIVIPIARRPRVPYRLMAIICCMSWAVAALSTGNLVVQAYYSLATLDQQLAWDARR